MVHFKERCWNAGSAPVFLNDFLRFLSGYYWRKNIAFKKCRIIDDHYITFRIRKGILCFMLDITISNRNLTLELWLKVLR